jgi:hypothetical protein
MARPEPKKLREAVAHFSDPMKLEAAISDLQSHGFDRADISFVAHAGLMGEKPATAGQPADAVADDPAAPREAPVESTDMRQGRALVTSMSSVIAVFAAAGFAVATGGTAALAAGVAAAAGIGVGAASAAIGKKMGDDRRQYMEDQLDDGGVLVWVRTRDAAAEARAVAILRDAGGLDAHLHDVPATA